VAQRYTSDLRSYRSYRSVPDQVKPHARILEGLKDLSTFLISQVDILEDETQDDKERKKIWDRIPSDVVDPAGLAVELGWRAARELNVSRRIELPDRTIGAHVEEKSQPKKVRKKVVTPKNGIVRSRRNSTRLKGVGEDEGQGSMQTQGGNVEVLA